MRGIAYFPTGSPTYDYYGADRIGANLFGTSLVALDARTGKRLWHFQMVHHDLWDYDNAAAPQLTTIRHNGQLVDVVAQAGKTGFLYVFNRVTGEPIWPIEERPVPPSDVPGEQAWPTQPFPTNPPPFAKQSLNENEINQYILTPEDRAMWKDRISKARKGGLFIPPAVGIETVAIPGAQGGANWGTTAAHPTNGSVYVLSINVPSIYKLDLVAAGTGRREGGTRPRCRSGSADAGTRDLRTALPELPRRGPRRRGELPLAPEYCDPDAGQAAPHGHHGWPARDAAEPDALRGDGCARRVPGQSNGDAGRPGRRRRRGSGDRRAVRDRSSRGAARPARALRAVALAGAEWPVRRIRQASTRPRFATTPTTACRTPSCSRHTRRSPPTT